MPSRDRSRAAPRPQRMTRVALVVPRDAVRAALVRVADAGTVEVDRTGMPGDRPLTEAARLAGRHTGVPARLAAEPPDLAALDRAGRSDLLAGEAELAGYAADAVVHGDVAALLGWVPTERLEPLAARLAEVGAAATRLPWPRGVDPPTVPRGGTARAAFAPLVRTYATAPYPDVDATVPAGLAYLVMFGAMFGDVGHGALLVLAALVIRTGRPAALANLRPYWLFGFGAGVASMLFGFGYGECFGPTGAVPAWWLAPLDRPVPLLVGGVGLGAVLLAGAYALGTVNRYREGGWAVALYAPSGVAGALLFLAAATATAAWSARLAWVWCAAGGLTVVGLALAYAGLLSAAGRGGAGVLQATIELFDAVIRLVANTVSFARLAAFGLTHAVLGWIVWAATLGLVRRGGVAVAVAVLVFAVGNAVTFGLEALVAGVQALRLEYYELFSRVFQAEGRPFRPWHVPLAADVPVAGSPQVPAEESSCSPG